MTSTVHTAGIEGLIWVGIIIFSMVAQAVKGMKKFKEDRPGQLPFCGDCPFAMGAGQTEDHLYAHSRPKQHSPAPPGSG